MIYLVALVAEVGVGVLTIVGLGWLFDSGKGEHQ